MKSQKILTKKIAFLFSSIGLIACANANQFEPAKTPIFSMSQAKPNIHMLFDDSASMQSVDVSAPEHTFGFGQPVCVNQSAQWHSERTRLNEYDPFQDGTYKPWNDDQAVNGLINGKKKPPRIMECAYVSRTDALDNVFRSLIYKYRERSYLGVSVLWQVNNEGVKDIFDSLIRLPLSDYSELSSQAVENEIINPISTLIKSSPGQTPLYPAVYEAIKMYRGQPVTLGGVTRSNVSLNAEDVFPYKLMTTPLRYRCQENHLVVMTDGEPNMDRVWGIDLHDGLDSIKDGANDQVNGVNVGYHTELVSGSTIGRATSSVDLRYAHKPMLKDGQWVEKTLDDAGKSWTDELSVPMPIITHSVSLFVDPLSRVYLDMTEPTGGMNLGFGDGEGNAEDLLLAFDTIFSSIIKSTSSTVATNDKTNSVVLEGSPVNANGDVDLSKAGSIRYDTTYNFDQQMGNIRAIVPYIKEHTIIEGQDHIEIDTVELWNTDLTVKAEQGNYLTFLGSDDQNSNELTYLTDPKVKDKFKAIHDASKYGESFNDFYIAWLMKGGVYEGGNGLRSRLLPLGSITNSDLVLANKDVLYINIAKDKMAQNLARDLVGYVKYKANYQPVNHLIVSDNDGFINFVNAQRGLTGHAEAGARNTAYFPQLLAHRLDEIAGENRLATLVLEGKNKLSDVKIHDSFYGDLYATIGLTSMGSGGKGIVGYRVFGAPVSLEKLPKHDLLENVKPLFEITNEGPESFRTKGFENLGYTYSGFEVFNRMVTKNGKNQGQAVAVFGNGFGADKSILYFIDAYTGEKLHEIILNPHGGGASTPSIVIQPSIDGQALNRIYVGDYSGTLYKINFNGKNLDDGSVTVTALFQATVTPNNYGQSAISVKPLVTKNKSTGLYSVAFGTGNATSYALDRGSNSLVEHSVYNVVDHNNISDTSTTTVALLSKSPAALSALLKINDLNVGKVNYTQGSNINYYSEEKHDLEITAPESSNQNANRNGWAMRLVADGTASGERTIQNAKYDSENNNIVFVTWGMHESNVKFEEGAADPCISDMAFGKVLSFDADTGKSSGKKGIYNKGTTGTAEGGLTGNGIVENPEGNDIADLDDFQEGLEDEISAIVGEDDSSSASQEEPSKLDCVGDIFGKPSCTESVIEENHDPLPHGRVNFKKINSYY